MSDATRITEGILYETDLTVAAPVGTVKRDGVQGRFVESKDASSALYGAPSDMQSVLTTVPGTIGGATAEAAFASSYTIPASSLTAGDVISFLAVVTTPTTVSTDTLTARVRLGGLAGTQIVTSGAVDVANADVWFVKGQIVIRTVGATGTMVAAGQEILDAPGTATESWVLQSAAVNTTTALDLVVTAEWSTTNANVARLDVLNVW